MINGSRAANAPSEPDALRALWPTAAEPATFAPPIEIEEDEEAFTLLFDVAQRGEQDLEVQMEGQVLVVLGEALPRSARRARRVFALPSGVDPARATMELESPVLKVKVPKSSGNGPRAIVVVGG